MMRNDTKSMMMTMIFPKSINPHRAVNESIIGIKSSTLKRHQLRHVCIFIVVTVQYVDNQGVGNRESRLDKRRKGEQNDVEIAHLRLVINMNEQC
ncbi:hypothetical protein Trydic_g8284 [Trypoxylus dichotomus]